MRRVPIKGPNQARQQTHHRRMYMDTATIMFALAEEDKKEEIIKRFGANSSI